MKKIESNGHVINLVEFHQRINSWGKENYRSFPWRETRNPYFILMSEVMLHRTQANQVQPVYEHFVEKYPDLLSLTKAKKQELHKILFSLGLRWRIDLIFEMVQELNSRFNGQIPKDKDDLLSLPGISEYIAGAVRCFSWDLPEPILDTNTVRVAGRLFGLDVKDSSRRNKRFRNLISDLLDKEDPCAYNYALLDLADKVCTKKTNPDCTNCPLLEMCAFGEARG